LLWRRNPEGSVGSALDRRIGTAEASRDGKDSCWAVTSAGSSWRLHNFGDDAVAEFEFVEIWAWWQSSAESVIAAAFGQLFEAAQMGPQNGAISSASTKVEAMYAVAGLRL
jgi:maltoporin